MCRFITSEDDATIIYELKPLDVWVTYFCTVLDLEGRAVREQQIRLTSARTGLEDTSTEDSSWQQVRAPAVALYEEDGNMIKTPHRLGLQKRSSEESSPAFGLIHETGTQILEDLVPGVFETSPGTQAELSSFWITKMAEGWPLIKQNFAALEARLKRAKDNAYYNFEASERAINSVGRKLALLDTRIGTNDSGPEIVSLWEAIEELTMKGTRISMTLDILQGLVKDSDEVKAKSNYRVRKIVVWSTSCHTGSGT